MMKKHGGTVVLVGILAAVGAAWLWMKKDEPAPAPKTGP